VVVPVLPAVMPPPVMVKVNWSELAARPTTSLSTSNVAL
jgi:hypothetical protein